MYYYIIYKIIILIMETLQIYQVMDCNKVLFKMYEQKNIFPFSLGFKLFKIMKIFDEVEEYVFNTMDMTFPNYDWGNLTKEESEFYSKLLTEKIELDFEKIPKEIFENNDKLMLSLEDIGNLSIILF